MLTVRTEGFNVEQTASITALTRDVQALAAKATSNYVDERKRWFGTAAETKTLVDKLKIMDNYLNKKCSSITFVKKNIGHKVDSVAVQSNDYGQVIPNVGYTTANFKATEWHVSGGLRVYAMNEYFNAEANGNREELINYVYHEICHKVLDTKDYCYGPKSCKALAIQSPDTAVKNADNYGYFIAAVDAKG